MAGHLDVALLGALEVSARESGGYAILDGQHRWAAVLQAGGDDTHLVCHVHTGLSAHDEARLALDIDTRRAAWSWWDRWKAHRSEGDSQTLAIDEILQRYQLRIDPAPREGHVRATKAVETIVADLGGYELLDRVLAILTAAFGRGIDGLDGAILQGTALVLGRYGPELDVDRLVTRLQALPPRQLRTRALALRENQRGTIPRLCAAVIVEHYNGGRGRNLGGFLDRAPSTRLNPVKARTRVHGSSAGRSQADGPAPTGHAKRRGDRSQSTATIAVHDLAEPNEATSADLDDPPMSGVPDPRAVRRAFDNGHGIRRVMDDFSLDYATVKQFRDQLTTNHHADVTARRLAATTPPTREPSRCDARSRSRLARADQSSRVRTKPNGECRPS